MGQPARPSVCQSAWVCVVTGDTGEMKGRWHRFEFINVAIEMGTCPNKIINLYSVHKYSFFLRE